MSICELFSNINWLWYAVAVIVTFAIGGLWYSALFPKTWVRIFKVEMPEKVSTASIIRTMSLQFVVSALFGLWFFVLVQFGSAWFAFITLCVFCGWQKGVLNFRYPKLKDFMLAVLIEAGYTFVAGIVFILFALIY